jgi:hypothetical protein
MGQISMEELEALTRSASHLDRSSPDTQDMPNLSELRTQGGSGAAPHNTVSPLSDKAPQVIDVAFEELEAPNEYYLRGALKHIQKEHLTSRALLVHQLQSLLPPNTIGLPEQLYRADMLSPGDFEPLKKYWDLQVNKEPVPQELREELDNLEALIQSARVQMIYDEGFPAIDGIPIWQPLPWEPQEAHQAFQIYLEQAIDSPEDLKAPNARSLQNLKHIPYEISAEWFRLYSWQLRIKCWELYKAAVNHNTKIRRQLTLDDYIYRKASSMLTTVLQHWSKLPDEAFANMSPDKFVAMFEKLTKIQRESVGLLKSTDQIPHTTVNIQATMQQVAQVAKESEGIQERALDPLFDSPEGLEAAQHFLIAAQGQELNQNPKILTNARQIEHKTAQNRANPDDLDEEVDSLLGG